MSEKLLHWRTNILNHSLIKPFMKLTVIFVTSLLLLFQKRSKPTNMCDHRSPCYCYVVSLRLKAAALTHINNSLFLSNIVYYCGAQLEDILMTVIAEKRG